MNMWIQTVEKAGWSGLGVVVLGLLVMFGSPGATEILRIEDLGDEELASEGFRLHRGLALRVECEGAGDGKPDEMYAYGWILDAETRELKWSLTPVTGHSDRERHYAYDDEILLPAGQYLAFYASYGGWRRKYKILKLWGKEIGRIVIDTDRRGRSHRDRYRWGIAVHTTSDSDESALETGVPEPERDPRVIAQMIRMRDGDFEERAFTLPEPMDITFYSQGEYDEQNDNMVDYGWVLDANTRRPVWELGPQNFDHGGGARKNKRARETRALPAGDYVVYYSCDDSHSSDAWNAPPPYDPEYWGITLWASSKEKAERVQAYRDDTEARTIVALIRQRDDSYVSQGFKLIRPARVRVYALGEYSSREFADHGWITDFKTHSTVWKMTRQNTRHAGGAQKNRVADEVVQLPAGEYAVYYMTDDSHSYREWNASPPHDPTSWGIQLLTTGASSDPSIYELFDAETREGTDQESLARLVRVRDGEHVSQRFRLDRPTRVRILALGEGLRQEMFDYGWIENADTGDWVWEMTGRNTRHAGGAAKNRIYDGVLLLDRGEYVAHFTTDDSHAWGHWNAARPPQPHLWGLTVTPADPNR